MPKKFSWSPTPLTQEEERLVAAYEKVRRPLDSLPYTEDFEKLVRELGITERDEEKAEVFRRLLNLRKTGWLPRTSFAVDAGVEPIPLSAEDQELLSAYQRIGRPLDSLPYTPDLDKLIDELGKSKTQAIKHAIFQRLLRLRKRGRLPRVSQVS
jgi:hypothetical protein